VDRLAVRCRVGTGLFRDIIYGWDGTGWEEGVRLLDWEVHAALLVVLKLHICRSEIEIEPVIGTA